MDGESRFIVLWLFNDVMIVFFQTFSSFRVDGGSWFIALWLFPVMINFQTFSSFSGEL